MSLFNNEKTKSDDPKKSEESKPVGVTGMTKEAKEGATNEANKPAFWVYDPYVIFDREYVMDLYPKEDMSFERKLNTVSRTVIFASIVLFVFTKNIWVLLVGLVTLVSIYYYYQHVTKKSGKEGYDNPAQVLLKSNGVVVPPKEAVFDTPKSTNPFSNVLVTDYEYNPNKPAAPPVDDTHVKDTILEKAKDLVQEQNPGQPGIANKLFQHWNEELSFEQSLRPFYSTASTTIPNDQAGFLDFCYSNSISCKEGNLFACARNASRYTLY